MSNIVQIKRGRSVPNQGGLMPYELGYIVTKYEIDEKIEENNSQGGYLYIGDLKEAQTEEGKRTLVYEPVKIKAGYADIAGLARDLDNQGIERVKSIKVDSAVSADSATNAENAENAKKQKKLILQRTQPMQRMKKKQTL